MDDFEIFREYKLSRMKPFEIFQNINFREKAQKSRKFLILKYMHL